MQVIVDTREHASEWNRISKQFDELGVKYFRLLFGKLNESTLFKLITPVFGIKGIDI